nr:hypothetical protein TSUD_89340 [Tanacetum cinerariifolium]
MIGERIEENNVCNVKLRLVEKRDKDGREYNLPTANEVATIIIGDFDDTRRTRDIIVEGTSGVTQRISKLHPSYLPLQYPLLFPYAEDGYRDKIFLKGKIIETKNKRWRLSMREWLSFIRRNKKILRIAPINNLNKSLEAGNSDASKTCNHIVLPSTYTGGTRYKIQNYLDAVALCKAFGYPDLFITFTCNPKWPEINRFMQKHNVSTEDGPDVLTRVFKQKLDQLIYCLRKNTYLESLMQEQKCNKLSYDIESLRRREFNMPTDVKRKEPKRHSGYATCRLQKQGTREQIVDASLNHSYIWEHCTVLKLTTNMHLKSTNNEEDTKEIKEFADRMLKVSEGEVGPENDGEVEIEFPDDVLIKADGDTLKAMTQFDLRPHMEFPDWTEIHDITTDEWDKYIQFWNDPRNIARAAQNWQNQAKSTVISLQGSWSLARLRDEMRQSSTTQEYPSLIDTFFVAHTVNGEFLRDEDRRIYEEMRRLEATGTYTDDEINRLARGGKQRGHIPGVGRVLPAQATASPSTLVHESTLNSLHEKVDSMMSLFKIDSKYSDMFSQFESGGASGSDGCGDDEEGADDQDDEDEDGDGDT